jgi:hypothetical protein
MKWYFKVLLAFIGLLLIVVLSIDLVVARIADRSIKRIQLELKDRYRFDYDKIEVSFLKKNIVLKNFTFESVIDSGINNNKFDFYLKKLHLKIDNYKDVIGDGKINIRIAELKNPIINYGVRREMNKDKVDENSFNDDPQLEGQISTVSTTNAYVSSLFINELRIKNGKMDIYHLDDPDKKLIHSENVTISGEAFNLDFNATELDDIVNASEAIIHLQEIRSDELKKHDLSVKDVQFTYSKNVLLITGFRFKNSEAPEVYASKQKYRSPWLDIYVDTVSVRVNPWHIYNKGVLYINDVDIAGANATIYNDVTLALKPVHQPMPSRAIRDISIPLKIDQISIANSTLKYLHKTEAENTGLFELDEIEAIAQNITNIDYIIDSNPNLTMVLSALLWGSGELAAEIDIDLKHEIDYVYIKGSIINMPLQEAENMIKPLYGVTIKSGYLNELRYDLAMNENKGEGRMVFNYSDLAIDIKKDSLKHSDEDGNEKSNKFLNFVANEAIRTNNLPDDKKYVSYGYMIFDRSKNKPIFDLYWHSLQTGLMDIVVHDALYTSKGTYSKKKKKEKKENKAKGK